MLGMARLLFKLRHVEADEFDEVTTALDQAQVDWYQTAAGLLGFSAPAIWVRDSADYPRAREVIQASQQERAARLRGQGAPESFASRLRRSPLEVVGGLLLMLLVIGLMLWLPWLLWR